MLLHISVSYGGKLFLTYMESIQFYVCIPVEIQFEGPYGPDDGFRTALSRHPRNAPTKSTKRAVKPGHLDLASLAFAKVISKLGTGLLTLT